MLEQRIKQLVTKRTSYQWAEDSHCALPAHVDANPLTLKYDANFEAIKYIDFGWNARDLGGDYYLTDPLNKLIGCSATSLSMEEFSRLEIKPGEPNLSLSKLSRWSTDVEFGRQMLNGVNPIVVERCTSLPDNFPVTDDMMQPYLDGEKTLKEEMEVLLLYFFLLHSSFK